MTNRVHIRTGGAAGDPETAFYPTTTVPTVVAEEAIAEPGDWNNGAGPTWDYGCKNIARIGDSVFASVSTADPDAKPYRNVFWNLFRRVDGGTWERIADAGDEREREPCPIVATPNGSIVLSTTPAIGDNSPPESETISTRNEPKLLVFDSANPAAAPDTLMPAWDSPYDCFEHSYRGFSGDGETGALFITQQVRDPEFDTHSQAWAYRNPSGEWAANGLLRAPMRGCYPAISVRSAEVHVVTISDETEPNEEWREFKREVTGKYWDYDFRQLFYTWTPDVTRREFSQTLTIDSADEAAGHISHSDLWVDDDGVAYVVYTERSVWHEFMRDRYWPDLPIRVSLKLAIVRNGRVIGRRTIVEAVEDRDAQGDEMAFDGPVPSWANFHATPDGRLFLLWHQQGGDDDVGEGGDDSVAEGMYIKRLLPDEPGVEPVRIPLTTPLTQFFDAAERAGTNRSYTIDLLGHAPGETAMRYTQLRLESP